MISTFKKNYWEGIIEKNQSFAKKLWQCIFDNEDEIFYFFNGDVSDSSKYYGLILISTNGWQIIENKQDIMEIFSIPSDEWIIKRG